jgi:ADP-heptose:LPS heptosyltransferase
MNIKLMRSLDYWLGLPLCFVLSNLNCILKLAPYRKKDSLPVRNALFIKLSELGAIILAYPLLRRLKEEYCSAELFFVTFEKNRSIFALLEGIVPEKNILTIRDDSIFAFALDTMRIIKKLRHRKIDIVFDLEFFSRFSAILTYLVKAGKRIGFYRYTFEGLYRGELLTHKIQYNPLSHMSKTFLSLSQAIKKESKSTPELDEGLNEKEIIFPKYVSKKEIKENLYNKLNSSALNKTKRLFLLNPGEGILPLREWPLENFITLSQLILKNSNNSIIIVGTEGAVRKGELILEAVNNSNCINFIGKTSLEELMELFETADALISNDCGLAHLAMLTTIKKFIIFGPESPQVFGPLGHNNWIIYSNWPCSPCLSVLNSRNSACQDNVCLKVIRPEYVYELIGNSLK